MLNTKRYSIVEVAMILLLRNTDSVMQFQLVQPSVFGALGTGSLRSTSHDLHLISDTVESLENFSNRPTALLISNV